MGHQQRCTWPLAAVAPPKVAAPLVVEKPPRKKLCCFLITHRRTSMHCASQILRFHQHRGETLLQHSDDDSLKAPTMLSAT